MSERAFGLRGMLSAAIPVAWNAAHGGPFDAAYAYAHEACDAGRADCVEMWTICVVDGKPCVGQLVAVVSLRDTR